MKRICYIVAMEKEAAPLIDHFNLKEVTDYFSPLPCRLFQGNVEGKELFVVLNGSTGTESERRDLIGCEAASITTQVAIQRLSPDIIISSGTAGGLKRHGTVQGKVYLGSGVMFHDRIVPGDNQWDTQGLGNYPIWEGTKALRDSLNAKGLRLGYEKVTTGSSFALYPENEELVEANNGRLIDMEGAAVAFVCSLYKTPVMLVKVVSNLCDEDNGDIECFLNNLDTAAQNLLKANIEIIKEL